MKSNVEQIEILKMTRDLRKISRLIDEGSALAHEGNHKFLSYLLNMAHLEARSLLDGEEKSRTAI